MYVLFLYVAYMWAYMYGMAWPGGAADGDDILRIATMPGDVDVVSMSLSL